MPVVRGNIPLDVFKELEKSCPLANLYSLQSVAFKSLFSVLRCECAVLAVAAVVWLSAFSTLSTFQWQQQVLRSSFWPQSFSFALLGLAMVSTWETLPTKHSSLQLLPLTDHVSPGLESLTIIQNSLSPHKIFTVLKAGVNDITVTWELSASAPAGSDSDWKTISLKLCYAPASQKDRAWRKTVDPISKDKTCQFKIASVAYGTQKTVTWIVQRNTPTAYYFIRAYVLNAAGHEVAYGQTTNYEKKTNIFFVEAVTGRHVSLDIASIVFSAFSVLSLVFFFWLEKSKGKRASKN